MHCTNYCYMVVECFFYTLASLGTKSDSIMCQLNQQLDHNGVEAMQLIKKKVKFLWEEVKIFQNHGCLGIEPFVCARPI